MRLSQLLPVALLLLACAPSGLGSAEPSERGQPKEASGAGGDRARSAVARDGLKLATWNLEWLNRQNGRGPVKRDEEDYARLRKYVERLDADVIALQEVDGVEAARRLFDPARYELYVAAQSDPQRTGFAYRKELAVAIHPDYAALDVGQVRVGADITITHGGRHLRLLSVHLKSGCFDGPPSDPGKDCRKLFAQLPSLEAWIDERAVEGVAAIVLGDFNRRLFVRGGDPFWRELDDAAPPASDLWSPTEGQRARCWNGKYPDFIDHLVLNLPATAWVVQGSFEQLLYDASDAQHRDRLSDHCPLSLRLTLGDGAAHKPSDGGQAPPASAPAAEAQAAVLRIKGNLGAKGRKLYHEPGCPDYTRTVIDEARGERWFESAEEAERAGFQRASNCKR